MAVLLLSCVYLFSPPLFFLLRGLRSHGHVLFLPCIFSPRQAPNDTLHLPALPPLASGRVLKNKPALSRPWLGGLASPMRVSVFLPCFLFTLWPAAVQARSFCAAHLFPLPSSERCAASSCSSTPCSRTCVREQTCFEPTLAWRSCFSHACTCFPFLFAFYSVPLPFFLSPIASHRLGKPSLCQQPRALENPELLAPRGTAAWQGPGQGRCWR